MLLAQVWSAVPMAGAIALVAWGTVLNVGQRRELLILAALIYTPLGILAVMSQVDLAMDSSLAWGLGYCGQPHILARFMAIRDPKAMKIATIVAEIPVIEP